jgi:hypothetical protein
LIDDREELLHALIQAEIFTTFDEEGVISFIVAVNFEAFGSAERTHDQQHWIIARHFDVIGWFRFVQSRVLPRNFYELHTACQYTHNTGRYLSYSLITLFKLSEEFREVRELHFVGAERHQLFHHLAIQQLRSHCHELL